MGVYEREERNIDWGATQAYCANWEARNAERRARWVHRWRRIWWWINWRRQNEGG